MRTRNTSVGWPAIQRRGLLLLMAVVLALTGCTVGPKYAKPAAPAPPDYQEVPPDWKTAKPSDQIAKGKWWEIFQDPQLNGLEEQINVSNQSLKAGQEQFLQGRAALRIPTLNCKRENRPPTPIHKLMASLARLRSREQFADHYPGPSDRNP